MAAQLNFSLQFPFLSFNKQGILVILNSIKIFEVEKKLRVKFAVIGDLPNSEMGLDLQSILDKNIIEIYQDEGLTGGIKKAVKFSDMVLINKEEKIIDESPYPDVYLEFEQQ